MQLVPLAEVRQGDYVRMTNGYREVVAVDGRWIYLDRVRVPRPGMSIHTIRPAVTYELSRLRQRVGDWAHRMEATA